MLQKVAERRNQDRLDLSLKVFEQETGEVLGFTENIHCEGMMLMSVRPFTSGKVINVIIEIPGQGVNKKLALTVKCCWCATDKKSLIYNVGFHFLHASPEMKTFYETLFDGLGE